MPLETLLAMYGYSDDNNPDANVDVPLDEIKPEPLPPLDGTEDGQLHEPVPTSVEGRLPLVDPPQEITAPPTLDENALSPPSPNSAPSLPVSHGNNNYFPENQRITRGCKLEKLWLSITCLCTVQLPLGWLSKGPFTLAIFAAILAAISWRFHGDFKSPV